MLPKNHAPIIFSAQLHKYLFPCPLPDGTHRLQRTVFTLLDDHKSILISVQDLTEHIQLSKSQKASNQRLQEELHLRVKLEEHNEQLIAAVDQAAEAIIIIDVKGLIHYTNQTFVQETGWQNDDVVFKKNYHTLHPDYQPEMENHVMATVRSGQSWQGRQQIKRKDGSSFMANVSIAPIVGKQGDIERAIVIQEDISQHLALEEQYRNTQKREALTTLVGGIAHDFNNLLSGMLGHLYLASREVKELPKTMERLEKIQKSAYDAADIVKQLITFSRHDQLQATDFPLDSFLKEISKLIEHNVPENIDFSLDFEHGKFPLHGDADQLQQSIVNMVQNAVEACAKVNSPKVRMNLKAFDVSENALLLKKHPALQQGEYAQIIISDNGCGIRPDHIERIFDPFFTTKQIGSGLGLATVLGSIRHHHGIIEVESELGKGTTLHIFLPLQSREDPSEHIRQERSDQKTEARILLVDDDPLVRETCAELLTSLGHDVTPAIDGQDAVEIFELHQNDFDIVIMDMVMPRMNGPAATRNIREMREDIPVIFATAYDQSISIRDATQFKLATLITKPFNPDALQELIASLMHNEN